MKFLAVAVLICSLVACATNPDEISASSVSSLQYKNYSCQQVSLELDRVQRRVNELHANLKKTAENDTAQMAVGLILFFPTLFFLEGGDGPQAVEYARLKGEAEALEKVAIQKSCSTS